MVTIMAGTGATCSIVFHFGRKAYLNWTTQKSLEDSSRRFSQYQNDVANPIKKEQKKTPDLKAFFVKTEHDIKFEVRAPGKFILIGEHSVVYNKPALAASIQMYATVHVTMTRVLDSAERGVEIQMPDLGVSKFWKVSELSSFAKIRAKYPNLDPLMQIRSTVRGNQTLVKEQTQQALTFAKEIEQFFSNSEEKEKRAIASFVTLLAGIAPIFCEPERAPKYRMTLKVTSEIPLGAGLGSSAAYSSALAAAFFCAQLRFACTRENSSSCSYCYSGLFCVPQKEAINSWAFVSENLLHGKASGLDNRVSCYGFAVQNYGNTKNLQSSLKNSTKPLRFGIVNSKIPKSTQEMVAKVQKLVTDEPEKGKMMLRQLENIALKFFDVLENTGRDSWFTSLSKLITETQPILNGLGIGHSAFDQIEKISREHGYAFKITGAGGGGCGIVLLEDLPNKTKENLLKSSFEKAGFEFYTAPAFTQGVYAQESQVKN